MNQFPSNISPTVATVCRMRSLWWFMAESVIDGKEQRLKLFFATHEMLIERHNLRRIEIAIQIRD
jgi:hypothetical protein